MIDGTGRRLVSSIYLKLCASCRGLRVCQLCSVHPRYPIGPIAEVGKYAPATVTHRCQPCIGIYRVFNRARYGYADILSTANYAHTGFFGYGAWS